MHRLSGKYIYGLVAAALLSACGNVPVIREITPGEARPGEVIKISGESFGSEQGKGSVKFRTGNDGPATAAPQSDILAWANGEVTLRVPAGLAEGPYAVQLEHDNGNVSNKKEFKVLSGSVTPGSTLVVANQSQPGLEVFDIVLDGTDYKAGAPLFSVSLAEEGAQTSIRSLAVSVAARTFYATVLRRDRETGAETSALLAFGGVGGAITAPTLVDAGVQPTGMAVSPDGSRLYVAATASGLVYVVDTYTNLVQSTLSIDLASYSYGFEPLGVAAYAAPSTAYGESLVTVTGNNWFLGRGEVITYAPSATGNAVVSHLVLDGYTLAGPLGVSAPTAKVWVVGDDAGKPSIALLDVTAGTLVDARAFEALPGYTGAASGATDVLVDHRGARVWAALPGAGVAEITMAAGATEITSTPIAIHALTNPRRLAAILAPSGRFQAVLASLPEAGAVAFIDPTLEDPAFAITKAQPTEIITFTAPEVAAQEVLE